MSVDGGVTGKMARRLVEDGLMTIGEASAFLSVSRATLYNIMDAGDLPFVKLGRSRRIPKRAIVQLAASRLVGGSSACES